MLRRSLSRSTSVMRRLLAGIFVPALLSPKKLSRTAAPKQGGSDGAPRFVFAVSNSGVFQPLAGEGIPTTGGFKFKSRPRKAVALVERVRAARPTGDPACGFLKIPSVLGEKSWMQCHESQDRKCLSTAARRGYGP